MGKPHSKTFWLLAIIILHGVPAQAADRVDNAVTHLLNRLRTPALEEAAASRQKALRGKDEIARREAVRFFADLRAKEVLLACLRSGDLGLRDAASECLNVFGSDDLADLYRTAETLIPPFVEAGSDNITGRNAIVEGLARRTSSILGIEHVPFFALTKKGGVHQEGSACLVGPGRQGRQGIQSQDAAR